MIKSIVLSGLVALALASNVSAATPQQSSTDSAELTKQTKMSGFQRFRKCQKIKRCQGNHCTVIRRCS